MPKVSIVVPVFNGSSYIERNTRYILEQEHKDIEVIFVVDSRTTDDSLSKLNGLLSGYDDAVIVEQNGGGLGQARNLGIERAKGELIWFLDVDDHPLPRYLSTLVRTQQEYGADVVIGNFIRSKDTDPVIKTKKTGVKVMDKYVSLKERSMNRIPVTAWSMVIRTELIRRNGLRFIEEGYAEDVDFTNRLLFLSDVVCFCEEPLYVYVQSQDSICGSSDNERGTAEIASYERLIEDMKEKDPEFFESFRRSSVRMMMRSATRMDAEYYRAFVSDETTVNRVNTELAVKVDPEMVAFKLFPRAYRFIGRVYMKLVFYREGKTF